MLTDIYRDPTMQWKVAEVAYSDESGEDRQLFNITGPVNLISQVLRSSGLS